MKQKFHYSILSECNYNLLFIVSCNSNNSDWMKNLPKKLQEMKITDIAIPGSHDSGTYSLSKDEIYVNIFKRKVCRDSIPFVLRL